MLESHLPACHPQGPGIGSVPDLRPLSQEPDQAVHVGQGVADLAIHRAQQVQRHEQLDQQGVHRHQVAETELAVSHPVRCQEHHPGHPCRHDGALAQIEQGKGGLRPHRGVLPLPQGGVAAPSLVRLVVEVLDRLVVDQALHRLVVGRRLQTIHLQAVPQPPVGHGDGEEHERGHGGEDDQAECPGVLAQQDPGHQQEFHRHRNDGENQVVEQGGQAGGPALEVPADGAGLAVEVEAQGKGVEVLQGAQGEPAHGPVANPGEQYIPDLGEAGGEQPQGAIAQQQGYRQRQGGRVPVQGVHDLLENQGHAHVGALGRHQRPQRHGHPPPVVPQVGQQRLEIVQVAPVALRRVGILEVCGHCGRGLSGRCLVPGPGKSQGRRENLPCQGPPEPPWGRAAEAGEKGGWPGGYSVLAHGQYLLNSILVPAFAKNVANPGKFSGFPESRNAGSSRTWFASKPCSFNTSSPPPYS